MDGLVWWQGRVENINDPEKSGKVQVQIYNFYELPPKGKTQRDSLPWCIPILPTTSPSIDGVGDTPQFVVGSRVMGFFSDGNHAGLVSKPYIVGTMPISPEDENKNSISLQARGKNSDEIKKIHPVEPDSAYKAEYPLNRVIRSRKGHKIELDDTDGSERIYIYHASGTSIEMAPDGRLTIRNPGDSFEVVGGVKNIAVTGNANIEVGGNLSARIKGAASIVSDTSIAIESKGILRLMGLLGVQISSGSSVTMQAPAGANVTEGSLHVMGRISSGTGLTTNIIAGGSNIGIRNGIAVRGG